VSNEKLILISLKEVLAELKEMNETLEMIRQGVG
jgi:hypothetical protein